MTERAKKGEFGLGSGTVGVNATQLRDYAGSIEYIDASLKSYDATLVRGRARLIVQKAEAHWELGEIDACVLSVREAFLLAHSAGASKTMVRARRLATHLLQSQGKERQITELSEVLSATHV